MEISVINATHAAIDAIRSNGNELMRKAKRLKQTIDEEQLTLAAMELQYKQLQLSVDNLLKTLPENEMRGALLELPIEETELRACVQRTLKASNLLYVSQLANIPDSELLKIPNFGRRCLSEVKQVVFNYNLSKEK